jgi:murein DD-endopeptidase MepM/ murein hydrolase activator NlpD
MSRVAELLRSRRMPQVAVLTLMSVGFAGCSADMQTRFSDFSNPFASQPEATGSVRTPAAERREQPQYARPQTSAPQFQSQALPPPAVAAPPAYPASSGGVSGGGRGISSYAPPSHSPIETTATVPPRSVAATRPATQNGATIIVGTSDTLDGLAKRYNVSSAAILQANGYKGPRVLSPGQQLIIPRQTAVAAAAPALAPAASKPLAAAATTPSSVHIVNRGDTLMSISRRNNVPVAELAKANNLDQTARLSLGMKLTVPGSKSAAAAAAPAAQPVIAAVPAQPVATVAASGTKMAAAGGPPQAARLASATTNVVEEKPVVEAASVKPSEATGALPTFRWPVRGKVITTYGAKTNGKSNDGINLAVPEGTPVKAAEDGVVAYSGNELKGYGNLVLVRHSNGYVTAYAHASELMVKRGDTIKRGQIIAKSGQSGEVGSPQLHFEIRKGSSPVDPLQFLNGA